MIDIPPGARWTPSLVCGGSDAWVLYRGVVAEGRVASVLFHTKVHDQRALPVMQIGLPASIGSGVFEAADPILGPLVALGGGTAIVVGACPRCGVATSSLYATTDGGASWIRHEITSAAGGGLVLGLSFVSEDAGFAEVERIGSKGPEFHVLSTDDGGATWQEIGAGR